MVYTFLVQFLIFLIFATQAVAKMDKVHTEVYLGEKSLDSYSGRYQPLVFQDIYQGKMVFEDELFFQNYFQPYLLNTERDFSFFLRSELNGGLVCSNEKLSEHFDDIRYSYRLITLSYLIEGAWQLKGLSEHFGMKKGCDLQLDKWINTCRPKSDEMKKFVQRIKKYKPKYEDTLPKEYGANQWWSEFSRKEFKKLSTIQNEFTLQKQLFSK